MIALDIKVKYAWNTLIVGVLGICRLRLLIQTLAGIILLWRIYQWQ